MDGSCPSTGLPFAPVFRLTRIVAAPKSIWRRYTRERPDVALGSRFVDSDSKATNSPLSLRLGLEEARSPTAPVPLARLTRWVVADDRSRT